jgi:hypothetical protein
MWDSVSKPLLRIGKSGVSSSHLQSLSELLKAHGLVKVQLNAVHADVFAIGRQLSDGSGNTQSLPVLTQTDTASFRYLFLTLMGTCITRRKYCFRVGRAHSRYGS